MTQPFISVITTKLQPPRLGSTRLPRDYLLQKLSKRRDASVAIIMGPAGYGKTTLMTQWYEQLGGQNDHRSWLTLDEQDNVEAQFFSYLFSAFKRLGPKLALQIEEFAEDEQPADPSIVIATLINAVADSEANYSLFLDDYHCIDNEKIHAVIQYLLLNLPDNLNLYIGTRTLPPFSLARLKVQDRILMIGGEMLRFDSQEAGRFIDALLDFKLSPADLEKFYQQTQGWPAAMQMAVSVLESHQAPQKFLEDFSGSQTSIAEYLAEEVFNRLPKKSLQLLVKLSLFDRFTPALGEALSGDPDSRSILENTQNEALLLQRFEGKEDWYQFHPLARGFLNKRAQTQPETLGEIHRTGAKWFADHGYIAEAVQQCLEARDDDQAFELLEAHAWDLVDQGHYGTLANLVHKLPQGQISSCQKILIPLAWTRLLSHDFSGLISLLEQIEALIAQSDAQYRIVVEAEAATIRAALLAIQDQLEACRKTSEQWQHRIPSNQLFARATLANVYSVVLLNDYRFDEVLALQQRTDPLFQQLENPGTNAYGLLMSAMAYTEQMRLKDAAQAYDSMIRISGKTAHREPVTHHMARLMLGSLAYLKGDQKQALQLLEAHVDTLRQHALNDQVLLALPCLIRLYQLQGRWQEALAFLNTSLRLAAERKNVRIHACVLHEQVRLLLTHDPDAAALLLTEQRDSLTQESNLDVAVLAQARERFDLAEARVRLATGDPVAAASLLNTLWKQFNHQGRRFKELTPLLLLAQANMQLGNQEEALSDLNRALDLDPEGLALQVFIDDGEPLLPLFSVNAQQEGPRTAPCLRINELLEQKTDQQQSQSGPAPEQLNSPSANALLEPLTKKETAVLRLVAEGLSNREAAERAFVSIETIKTHLKSIYSKMGVARRTQAVSMGRELGLID